MKKLDGKSSRDWVTEINCLQNNVAFAKVGVCIVLKRNNNTRNKRQRERPLRQRKKYFPMLTGPPPTPPSLHRMNSNTNTNTNHNGKPLNTNDAIRKIREDIMRGEYNGGISSITALLGEVPQPGGGPAPVLNTTQRLRLHLLRCDCYSGMRSHQRGLEEAKIGIALSNALSPQAFFLAARECYRLGKVREALDNFENAETLMSTGVGVAEIAPADLAAATQTFDSTNNNQNNPDEDAWANIGVCPQDTRITSSPLSVAALTAVREATGDGMTPSKDGLIPIPSGARVPVTPSYEWAQELEWWRKCYAEAKVVQQMTKTHLVPSRLANQAIQYVCKDAIFTSNSSRTSQVIVIRNTMAKWSMRLAYTNFSDCAIVEPFSFPQVIPPGEVAIGVVCGTSWAGGSKGTIAYTIEMSTVAAGFVFEAPMMSDYGAACWVRSGRGSSDRSGAPDVKVRPRPTATEEIVFKDTRCKALVSQISRVVTFALTEVQPVMLTTTELIGVLEFLPAPTLRRCSAASWHIRDAISHLPPQLFWTSPPSVGSGPVVGSGANPTWFPNYLFPSDYVSNPWIIRGMTDVTWQIAFDGLQRELEEYCLLDSFDCRVLTMSMDLQAKGLAATLYYGGGKRRQQVSKITEGWSMFSRPASTWKLNNGRKMASVTISSAEVTLTPDFTDSVGPSDEPMLVMRRGIGKAGARGTAKPPSSPAGSQQQAASKNASSSSSHAAPVPPPRGSATMIISRMPSNEVVAEVFFRNVPLNTTRKGDYVAELVMKPGCDAFLVSLLATFGRTKWGALPSA